MAPSRPEACASRPETRASRPEACAPRFILNASLLGVRVCFETNSPVALDLADGVLDNLDHADPRAPWVRIGCWLGDDRDADLNPALSSMRFGTGRDSFHLQIGSSRVEAVRSRGDAVLRITPNLLEQGALFQESFVECAALFLASHFRPATLHAAALAYAGHGVLLTGASGSGKSTLACASVRAGFEIAAEDVAFFDDRPTNLIAWGCGRYLHLLPDAPRFFDWLPPLAGVESLAGLNGEEKLRIPTEDIRSGSRRSRMQICAVALLDRSAGSACRLGDADPLDLRASLTGFDGDPPLFRSAMDRAVDRLLELPQVRLTVGADPGEAAETLKAWIESRFR